MYYANIKGVDVADGPGVRVSLFVSGCRHHCRECFNAMAWDFQYGKPYTEETQAELLRLLSPVYIQGLTLLGGEPFEPENQRVLVKLLRKVRETYPEKDIWCYTGYTYEKDLLSDSVSSTGVKVRTEVTDEMLSYIDCLVDGEFVLEKKDSTLLFRGSSNQRLIGLHGYQVPDERKRDHEIKHYEGVYIPTRTAP
ncbi:MAG: anaerobic ribonucleoside-triphosphate reductase activating protein [Lachnospiraceae bacterium]|jgi:anaerobic ribonucleoside-triphosphate reductase activating protein|nr:anaerobic ribonucleoside-triphosphate reductase activating protein [Lachnospiraceae bacterium]